MAHDSRRPDRVAEAIRMDIATFLLGDVKDPRIVGVVTVTGVDVTRDLKHAKVFVSIMGSDVERESTLQGLDSLASHLRSRLARSLRLRIAPEIEFKYDESVARAARIESLLESIKTKPDESGENVATPGGDAGGSQGHGESPND
jgi:ribosome-binding factor A